MKCPFFSCFTINIEVRKGLSGKPTYHGKGICRRCGKPTANGHQCPVIPIPFSERMPV